MNVARDARKGLLRGVLGGVFIVALTVAPAWASVSASYGTVTAITPTLITGTSTNGCTGYCMAGSATFKSSGTVATTVQVVVYLYRFKSSTQTAAVCSNTGPCSDTLLRQVSSSIATKSGTSATTTVTASVSCTSLQSATYGYYTRAVMSNGTSTQYMETSPLLKVKGC